jgi:vesicle-associated membrane protein 7
MSAIAPTSSLVYALVTRGPTVLAEHSRASGNFEVVARLLLGKLDAVDAESGPKRLSFEHDEYMFHVLQAGPLWFVVLADKHLPLRSAFQFLDAVEEKFAAKYSHKDWKDAITFGLAEFSQTLGAEMVRFGGATDPKVSKVREQLEEVKDVMVSNIDALLARGERIELLVDQTDRMSQAALRFEQSSVRLRQQMWWKRARNQVGGGRRRTQCQLTNPSPAAHRVGLLHPASLYNRVRGLRGAGLYAVYSLTSRPRTLPGTPSAASRVCCV